MYSILKDGKSKGFFCKTEKILPIFFQTCFSAVFSANVGVDLHAKLWFFLSLQCPIFAIICKKAAQFPTK
jgi:hypothetical protein